MDGIRTFLCFLVLCHSASSLELTGPSVDGAGLGSDALVPCSFTVDEPLVDVKHLRIFWHFQDKEILSYDNTVGSTSSRYSLNTEGLTTGIADLTISNIQIPDGGMYKCSVIYSSERKEKEIRLDIGAPPQVTITGKTVALNTESILRCSITGFYPVDIDIKWFKDGEKLNKISVGDSWRNPDRTYNVNSTVTITPTEEDRERNFSCRVQHEFLQAALREDFQLVYGDRSSAVIIAACTVIVLILIILIAGALWWKLKRRSRGKVPFIVRDIEGPPKLIDGEEATLYYTVDTCPENLCVTWLIRSAGQVQEIQTSQMRGHSEEGESLLDKSYVIKSQREGHQYLSSLSFIPHMERHKDVTFLCRGVSSQHNDEKTFHCKTIYGKPKMSHPVIRSLFVSGEMKYVINLEKFYPKSIKIVWKCGVGGEEVLSSTESPSHNPDRSYNVSSEVRITEDRHKDPGFRVRVTWEHESMDNPESRELSIRDSDYRWIPVIEEIQIPRQLHGTPGTLQCNISGYFPDAVAVKWMRRAGYKLTEENDAAGNQRITSRRAVDNTYSCTARLTITPKLQTHQGAEYICLVEHPSLENPIEKSTGTLQVIATPQMLDPIEITMADSSRVQFSLNLQKFYPKDIKISWHWENTSRKYELSAAETFRTQEVNLTYDVTSVVRISNHSFNDPEIKIIVAWKHEAMETPETRSLSIRDLPWRPHIESINVPELEDGKETTLTCNISGYFPDHLSVIWSTKKDGDATALPIESLEKDRTYKISEKKKEQKDKTYSCEASLTFTPLKSSDQGSEIICRVEHPSLEDPLGISIGPLQIGVKKQNILVKAAANTAANAVGKWFKGIFTSDKKIILEDEVTEDTGAEPGEETEILTPGGDHGS